MSQAKPLQLHGAILGHCFQHGQNQAVLEVRQRLAVRCSIVLPYDNLHDVQIVANLCMRVILAALT